MVLTEAVVKDVVVETIDVTAEAMAVKETRASVLLSTVTTGPMALVVIEVGSVRIQWKGISGMPHWKISAVDPLIIATIPESSGAILV